MADKILRPLADSLVEGKRLLTTNEGKMYDLYIIDGVTGVTTVLEDDDIFDGWYDHCINPKLFKELARKHNCTYTLSTFHKITEEYNCNYLNTRPEDNIYSTSIDGKRLSIQYCDVDDIIDVTFDGADFLQFKKVEELNTWLQDNQLKPVPVIDSLTEEQKDVWIKVQNNHTNKEGYIAYARYNSERNVIDIISVLNSDDLRVVIDYGYLSVDINNKEKWMLLIDYVYGIYGYLTTNPFEVIAMQANENSVWTRDEIHEVGPLDEGSRITKHATNEELTKYFFIRFGLKLEMG